MIKDKNTGGMENSDCEWVGPRRSSKNEIWKNLGFKKFPNEKTDYSKVYCKLCDISQNYGGTTINHFGLG